LVTVLLRDVTGTVRMKLYKGNSWAVSRKSERSLYSEDLATFGASTSYDQADAAGFIKLFGLPLRAAAERDSDERNSVVAKLLREVSRAHAE
jgi:argininosuccinate synthase